MFNFFSKKTARDFMEEAKETYGVPEQKPMWTVPPTPVVNEPKEKDALIFYRFGVTDTNRVAFSMGHSEITMNKQGCQEMIEEITFFMNRLKDDVEETSDSDDASTAKD